MFKKRTALAVDHKQCAAPLEDVLRQELQVDGPAVQEHTRQLERLAEVGLRGSREERRRQGTL